LNVERLSGEIGAEVAFEQVLMMADGETVALGAPNLSGASVQGRIVSHGRGKKVMVFKAKRRKGYRKLAGHRQAFTVVEIKNINKGA
jgi:large subunit ribosomal protein L21